MEPSIDVKPLPYKTRQRTFLLLIMTFCISLPFLYLYATGYRFDLEKPTSLVSTGGIYLAVDILGAEIYIDNELVRETRSFRKALYAQSLDVGTHRVHVQKEGHHTWVKELPVSKRLVTEAEAFNLPLVPQVRVIGEWQTATGSMVVREVPLFASSTNVLLATTTRATSTLIRNQEYLTLLPRFASTTVQDVTEEVSRLEVLQELLKGTSTPPVSTTQATSTVVSGGVRLALFGEDVVATWVGPFQQMPYYYCAADFSPYTGEQATDETLTDDEEVLLEATAVIEADEGMVMHPLQTVPDDSTCDPSIQMDRKGQMVRDFDFLPGSTDFVIMVLEDGAYIVEVDDRSWQNMQPLLKGTDLRLHIENGNIFLYDGSLIYQIIQIVE